MFKKIIATIIALFIMVPSAFAQTDDLFNDYLLNLPQEELSDQELQSLMQMREEEKLARDVYTALYEKWGINVFNNISRSEQTHSDMVALILQKYNLDDPFIDQYGVFADSAIQELYQTLVTIGSESMAKGLFVGCTIEDLDIYDLEECLLTTDNQDVRTVYQNLMKGSRNHMRSFNSLYLIAGETYQAQYITSAELEQILTTPSEQGFVDADGNPLTLTSVADADQNIDLPEDFILAQNYPNPFNPQTTIQFELPKAGTVSVNIYDVNGKLIKTLAKNRTMAAGKHALTWNGTDEYGNVVSSGMYMYRIASGNVYATNQMVFLK